jgi:hypothetical protein
MAKILIDGLQSSQYAFTVLYIYTYAHKSSFHHNKINWFFNLVELTISLNEQVASYKTRIPRPPFSYLMFDCYKKNQFSKCDEGVIPLLLLAMFHNFIYYGRRFFP